MQMHYIVYKTTNLVNGKIYIGAHKTHNLNDGYMGSGKHLSRAFNKYGKENFKTEILYELESLEEMYSKEAELVNEEFLKRDDVYNIKLGGQGGFDHLIGTVSVIDENGNTTRVSVNDSRYISGELSGVTNGYIPVKDKQGNTFSVPSVEFKNSSDLVGVSKGMVVVKDRQGDILRVAIDDQRYLSGKLKHICVGLVSVKDKQGNTFSVPYEEFKNSSDLVGVSKGMDHTDETKKKIGFANSKHQSGSGNSQYGLMWIYSLKEKKNMRIPKGDDIPYGWLKGRKMKFD